MDLLILLSVVALAASVQGYTVNDCPSSLPRDNYLQVHGSYCYTFVAHEREYHTAEAECKSRGGNLVVIRDSDTQQFIYNTFLQTYHFTSDVVWIGLTDRQTEGVHVWADGSPLSYTYWAPGEPSGASYDCTVMDLFQRGHWVDYMCEDAGSFTTHSHTFVCENRITGAVSAAPTTTVASGVYSTADCPSSLPANSHLYVHGSSCYDFVSSHTKEFNAAERECEQRNGHLVTIKNADTQQFIYNTFTNDLRYRGVVWIGINDQAREGHHVWVDGSPVTYTNWAPREPTGAAYDCGIMELSQHGQWFDYSCADRFTLFTNENAHHYFVCEYPLAAHTPIYSTPSPDMLKNCPPHTPTNGHLYVYGSSCYDFISSHSLEFANAEKECAANQGHLVTIHDAGTQSFVYNTFKHDFPRFDGVIWIGMTDQQYEGVHAWTDGSPVTYTNWALGQPSNNDPNTDCAIMNIAQGGTWADYRCNDTLPAFHDQEHFFVCEYPMVNPPATVTTTSSTSQPTTATTTLPPTTSTPTITTPPMHTTYPPTTATTPEPTTTITEPTTTTPEPTLTTTPEPTSEPTTPEPTTPEPTTPEPVTPESTPEPYVDTTPEMPEETFPPEETPEPGTTAHGHHTTTECPALTDCTLDCGAAGYKVNGHGCETCHCEHAASTPVPTCPPFECGLDCGLAGYRLDETGCMLCQCE